MLPCLLDGALGRVEDPIAGCSLFDLPENGDSTHREWHVATVSVLRQRQMCKTSLQVDILPRQTQQLTLAHGCFERDNDQRTHEGIASGVSSFEQALFFSRLQAT